MLFPTPLRTVHAPGRTFAFLFALVASHFATHASPAVPPAERLLPPDTLFLVTAPDLSALKAVAKNSALQQLQADPAMKPFVDNFKTKWREEVVQPLERELSIDLKKYSSLAQGQLSWAVLQGNGRGLPPKESSVGCCWSTRVTRADN
jgi:hypothetical protein